MILFKLYVTSWQNIAKGRNIRIKGNDYHVDVYTPEHLERYPYKIQNLDIHKDHLDINESFNKHPIIELR